MRCTQLLCRWSIYAQVGEQLASALQGTETQLRDMRAELEAERTSSAAAAARHAAELADLKQQLRQACARVTELVADTEHQGKVAASVLAAAHNDVTVALASAECAVAKAEAAQLAARAAVHQRNASVLATVVLARAHMAASAHAAVCYARMCDAKGERAHAVAVSTADNQGSMQAAPQMQSPTAAGEPDSHTTAAMVQDAAQHLCRAKRPHPGSPPPCNGESPPPHGARTVRRCAGVMVQSDGAVCLSAEAPQVLDEQLLGGSASGAQQGMCNASGRLPPLVQQQQQHAMPGRGADDSQSAEQQVRKLCRTQLPVGWNAQGQQHLEGATSNVAPVQGSAAPGIAAATALECAPRKAAGVLPSTALGMLFSALADDSNEDTGDEAPDEVQLA